MKNLIHRIPNMDTLVTLGVLSSFLYSLYSMYMVVVQKNLEYVMNLYFESSSIVIYFVKLGRYLEGISKDKTKEAIQKLVEITPNTATIEIDGTEKQVTLDEIKKGMIVICKPGEKIANELGLTEVISNVLPIQKADKIKELKQENRKVIMCGDGINDSPALANSDIWAFFYNCLMIPIAVGILKPFGISITPMMASFMMVISSITVCLNTLRLKKQI